MADVPLDPRDRADEPPDRAAWQMVRRLAVRLLRDHRPHPPEPGPTRTCRACLEPWPCRARQLAARWLLAAGGPGQRGREWRCYRNWFSPGR